MPGDRLPEVDDLAAIRARRAARRAELAMQEPKDEGMGLRDYAAMGVRGVGGLLASEGGAPGAAISALTELGAQTVEGRDKYNWPTVATESAIGAVPFGKPVGMARTAMKSGMFAGTGALARQQAEEGLHVPTAHDVGQAAVATGIGAVVGGGGHYVRGRFGGRTPSASSTRSGDVAETTPNTVPLGPPPPANIHSSSATQGRITPEEATDTARALASELRDYRRDPNSFTTQRKQALADRLTQMEDENAMRQAQSIYDSISPTGRPIDPVHQMFEDAAEGSSSPHFRQAVEDADFNPRNVQPVHETPESPITTRLRTQGRLPDLSVPPGRRGFAPESAPAPAPNMPPERAMFGPNVGPGGGPRGKRLFGSAAQPKGAKNVTAPPPEAAPTAGPGPRTVEPPPNVNARPYAQAKDADVVFLAKSGDQAAAAEMALRASRNVGPVNPSQAATPLMRGTPRPTQPKTQVDTTLHTGEGPLDVRRSSGGSNVRRQNITGERGALDITLPSREEAIAKLKSGAEKAWSGFGKAVGASRAMMATGDLSAPFRQGIFMVGRPEFWQNMKPMVQAAFRPGAFTELQQEIAARPTFQRMRSAGLALTDPHGNLTDHEEAFMNASWAEKIPGFGEIVKGSERAYVGFLNKLRADTFDSIVAKNPEMTDDATKALAKYINSATGRGDLGRLEKSAVELNRLFFSPRLIASRVQLLKGAGTGFADLPPEVRREALGDLFRFTGAVSTVLGIGAAAGAQVETDPRSSDFAKLKIGNTRVDIGGGFQQYIRAAAQIMTGEQKASSGEIRNLTGRRGQRSRLDVAEDFVEGKLSPIGSLVVALMRGTDFDGQPVDVQKEIINRFTPILSQDIAALAKDDPDLAKMIPLIGAAGMGASIQTYETSKRRGRGSRAARTGRAGR